MIYVKVKDPECLCQNLTWKLSGVCDMHLKIGYGRWYE